MKIQAEAGKRILTEQRDKYRLNLLQRDDNSPVLVLVAVTVEDGQEVFKPVAELAMSDIYAQVFYVLTHHEQITR